jgi:DNA-binding CsgD family transcriptional regulator
LAAWGAAQPRCLPTLRAVRPAEREWQPVPVHEVLGAVRRRPHRVLSRPDRWRQHVAAVTRVDLDGLGADEVRRHPSRGLARRRIAQMIDAERYEHLSITTEEVVSADAAAAALPVERDMLARGIELRMLGLPPTDGDRCSAYATELGGLGGEYREADALPLKLMIFDRRVALFPADPVDFEAGAIEVCGPLAVEQLCWLFHRLWTIGRDPRREGVPPIVLTPREKALVSLLIEGHSEESAANQLGVSRRTVLYTLRGLMDRIGVENRFQLALILGATGAASLPAPCVVKGASGSEN